ncbi:integrase [Deltaproteobacteria bacterium]|nr:integrase [Deltaproteobacteria bacterium]
MAKLIKPLTTAQVNNAKVKTAMYKLFDGGGLFLQINPSGGKYWKLKYRKDNGREGLLTFGKFPEVSLEQARRKRDDARAQKAAGIDPSEARRLEKLERQNRARHTFESLARAWLEVHSSKALPEAIKKYVRILEKYIFPYIGILPVNILKASNFIEILRRIESTGHSSTVKRARSACSLIMRFAIAAGHADFDPIPSLRGILRAHKKTHMAALTEPDDVGRLLRAIDAYSGRFVDACMLKIAPYLFVRPGELQSARWADINFETCEWRYTANKTDTAHIVPLCSYVMDILHQLHTYTGNSEYVFPSAKDNNKAAHRDRLLKVLRRIAIPREEMTAHGFRAMARTLLDEVLDERFDIIEQQLAHTVRDPNGRAYNRTQHLAERKRMMERWGQYLNNLRAGKNKIPPYNP